MVKAAIINTTDDMFGGQDGFTHPLGHRPDIHQGWGRVNIDRMLNPPVPVEYHENPMLLTESGALWTHDIVVDSLDEATADHPRVVRPAWIGRLYCFGEQPGSGSRGAGRHRVARQLAELWQRLEYSLGERRHGQQRRECLD